VSDPLAAAPMVTPSEPRLLLERGVLGAALVDPEAVPLVLACEPELFAKDVHRDVLAWIRITHAAGAPMSEARLARALEAAGHPNPMVLIAALIEAGVPAPSLGPYVRDLREDAVKALLARRGRHLVLGALANGDGLPVAGLLAQFDALTDEATALLGSAPAGRLVERARTWAELTAPPPAPPPYHWPGVVVQGACCLLSGAGDSLKSLIMLQLGVCTAAGRPPFPGEPGEDAAPMLAGPVVYVSAENDCAEEARRCRFLKPALGIPDQLPHPLIFLSVSDVSLTCDDDYRALWALVEQHHPVMVALDSAIALSGLENENDNTAVRRFLDRRVTPLARTFGTTVYLTGHSPKPPMQPGARLTDEGAARGAGGWRDGVDVMLRVIREPALGPDAVVVRCAKNRLGPKPRQVWIRLQVEATDADGRATSAALTVGGVYSDAGAGVHASVRRALEAALVALRDAPTGLYRADLDQAVVKAGASDAAFRRALPILRGRQPWPFGPLSGQTRAVVTEDRHGRRAFLALKLDALPPDDEWGED
jgi:hypothetical protein